MVDRRAFITGVLSCVAAPCLSGEGRARLGLIAATCREPSGAFAALLYDLDRGSSVHVPLPGRGHDIAVDATSGTCVAFARRPGTFAVVFRPDGSGIEHALTTPQGRHFGGHGVFTRDGSVLYTTENDYESERGIIGIWEVKNGYRRIGEFLSFGIDPHDINLLSDGRTLVVANGGLITHPDQGRVPLNVETMHSTLAYIDRMTGALIELQSLPKPLQKLSIRHLDVGRNDTVIFGCQVQGTPIEVHSLVGFHARGEALYLVEPRQDIHRALRHYVSSVSTDSSGTFAAITSSRGEAAVVVEIAKRRPIAIGTLSDVSGVAASPAAGEFLLTSGYGDVGALRPGHDVEKLNHAAWAWDNHAVRVPRTS